MIGFIGTFFYNLSYSQSIIALPQIYPFHKSLWHAILFLATDLSLQITMKSSCHFLFNHLGMTTLQNSTQYSNSSSLIQFSHPLLATDSRYIDSARTTQKICVTCQSAVHWSVTSTGHGVDHIEGTFSVVFYKHSARTTAENTDSLLLCDDTAYARMCLRTLHSNGPCANHRNTAPILLAACVLRPFPSSG
jgi:hypothetical protein